ncbi:MAG: PLP-dependent aminotransferase family protein [Verrucomicrobiae bacterium]|nr:PLP-dependent aminotransferase family protein [Verrucomicrobiae bacterium]
MKLALERPGLISLAVGFTDAGTLPTAEVGAIVRELSREPVRAQAALQYGTTAGLYELRCELARRCERARPDEIIVTNGSQQLLYLVAEVLCDPGDIVLVEDPTYFVFLGIVEARGLQTFGFSGLVELERKLEMLRQRRRLQRLKFLYLVSYFQNPTGQTWSLEAKREVLALLRHYERFAGHPIFLLEDAAYRDLRFEGADVPSFRALDTRRVLYAGTLTKPFATGMRVGYGVLPAPLRQHVLRAKGNHDFGTSNFLQVVLARALASGLYDRHLPVLARAYRRKRDVMLEALKRNFPATARYQPPRGGLYVWVELAPACCTGVRSRLFQRALDAGVLYVPGEMCYAADPTRLVPRNAMRLSFGAPSVGDIQRGVELLAAAIRSK